MQVKKVNSALNLDNAKQQVIKKYSFPVISIVLGLFVGVFSFLQQPIEKEKYFAERYFKPSFLGITCTYLILSAGLNIRIEKDKKARRK